MYTREDAIKIIMLLIEELKNNNIQIKESYLFGSIVSNKNKEYSDIDAVLVSDIFTGFGFEDRKKINPYILKINSSIEPHPFSIESFNKSNPFVNEIIKTGIKINFEK